MKAGWRVARVGEICTFNYGKALPESARKGGGTPVFGSNGVVGFHDSSITSGKTIVIGRKGSFGEVHYSEVPSWPIDTAYFVDEASTEQDIRWLFYRLGCLGLNKMNKAAAVPGLNREDAYRQEILLPPLPEQRRIAAILDKADALRTKRREALAQLDRLAQSIFVEMFGDPATNAKGWPISTLGDLLESATYGTSEKSGASGQFPVLRMNNITRTGEMDFSDLKYMDLDATERARYLVRAGDILFNRTNSADLVGKTAIFRQPEPMAYAGYLIRLRANADNDPEYLAGFMNTPYAKRVLRGMCKSIIGMANINATEVQGIRIARPPLVLQTRYRERIGSLNHVKASHRTMLAEQDRLFTSLQHRAFRGDL